MALAMKKAKTEFKPDYSLSDHQPFADACEKWSELRQQVIDAEAAVKAARRAHEAAVSADSQTVLDGGAIGPTPDDALQKAEYDLQVKQRALSVHGEIKSQALNEARAIVRPKLRRDHEKAALNVVRCLRELAAAFEVERNIRAKEMTLMEGPTGVTNKSLSYLDPGLESDRNGIFFQVIESLRASGYRV